MNIFQLAVTGALLLSLGGCEYAANPQKLPGEYRLAHTSETLTLSGDGTAIARRMAGHSAEMHLKWNRSPGDDEYNCTRLDFEPTDADGVEWHGCATKVLFRDAVFIDYPGADPDSGTFYEKAR